MSDIVTLTATPSGAQTVVATATVNVGGVPSGQNVTFTTADPSIATVSATGAQTANVTGITDPSGPSTRTTTLIGTTADGGISPPATITVVTSAGGGTTISIDFGTPTP